MQRTRFTMIGGFLGAGKTTAIARLARHYTDRGLNVGVVTNDQAYGLVDTESLRAQGFHVGEVPGACFCCKFNDLTDTLMELGAGSQPDVILTEPVGSCTDLMATVIQPLRHLFGDRYELSPLAVLCKPEHGRKILGGEGGGFTPQAAYIFLKQLEEAQVIVLSKVDRLTETERSELLALVEERFPGKRAIAASGTTGAGYPELIALLEGPFVPVEASLEIDYDTYAIGEAALGWLNCSVRLAGSDKGPWSLDALTTDLVASFSETLQAAGMEPGHVKVLATSGQANAVANWVASDAPVELSIASAALVESADVLVNIRAHGDPDEIAALVRQAVDATTRRHALPSEISSMQHFRPGRPVPVHRYATSKG